MIVGLGKKILSDVKAYGLVNSARHAATTQAPRLRTISMAGIKSTGSGTARDISAHVKSSGLLNSTSKLLNNKKIQGGAFGAIALGSFASGLDSDRQISNSFYQLTTGSPDFDNYALGTNVGARGLLAPLPGERMFGQSTIQPGSIGGGLAGGLAGLKMSGIKGGLIGGAAGAVAGQSLFAKKSNLGSQAVLTSTTYRDAWRANRRNAPAVDGSMAFGMYNARLG